MNIALIELTTSHEECIYSQVKFLKDAGYSITLIINPKLRNQISKYDNLLDNIETYGFESSNSFIKNTKQFAKLYKFLVKGNYDKVIFNTASSRKEIIALSFLLPRKGIQCYGTIHNLKKLNHSFSQKLISQNIKRYFVINDFLLDSSPILDKTITLESYYPIFFPDYGIEKLNTKNNDLWICVPGELDYNRRDYDLLLNMAQKVDNNRLKFIVLGKVDKAKPQVADFLDRVGKLDLEDCFILFDSFIENEQFHTYISNSDYIMAPVALITENYLTYKITGAYNLAFAYKKPLLCDTKFSRIEDMNENALFYNDQTELEEIIMRLLKGSLKKEGTYKAHKWDYSFQQQKYVNFINQNTQVQ